MLPKNNFLSSKVANSISENFDRESIVPANLLRRVIAQLLI